jgi:hypothetical protein
VRFRSFAVADLKMPRKAAYIKQNFNSGRDACNAYVVFKSDEPAVIEAALAKNNELVQGRHIRVDRAAQVRKRVCPSCVLPVVERVQTK